MKRTTLPLSALLTVVISSVAFAGPPDAKEMATTTTLRQPDSGFYIGVYGGANFAQDSGNGNTVASGPGFAGASNENVRGSGSISDGLGGVGGLKVGYNFKTIPIGGDFGIQPAVEVEGLYAGSSSTSNQSFGFAPAPVSTTTKSNLDTGSILVNGIVRLQTGTIFTPYLGVGVGGEYLNETDTRMSFTSDGLNYYNTSNRSADCLAFAVQGLAGFDVKLTDHWSLFTEYKFLAAIDPSFHYGGLYDGSSATYKPDYYGQHLINAGVKYNF